MLDEVEAALDDANIERFLDLLRAYQERAQFIVITHQRRTMEVADLLYGVTMAADGESKVLSRRISAGPRPRPRPPARSACLQRLASRCIRRSWWRKPKRS